MAPQAFLPKGIGYFKIAKYIQPNWLWKSTKYKLSFGNSLSYTHTHTHTRVHVQACVYKYTHSSEKSPQVQNWVWWTEVTLT